MSGHPSQATWEVHIHLPSLACFCPLTSCPSHVIVQHLAGTVSVPGRGTEEQGVQGGPLMVSPQHPQDFPGPGPSPGATVPAGQSSVFPGHCAHLLLTGENPRTQAPDECGGHR